MDEIKVIEIAKSLLNFKRDYVVKGIDDDGAVLKIGKKYIILTSDMMLRETHIPEILSAYEIGARILTANVSDLLAMGAEPLAFLLSLAVDRDEKFIYELYRGLSDYSKHYNCPIVGGDTVKGDLILSGFAIGITNKPLFREGKINDDIAVTNDIGRVYCSIYLYNLYKKGKISYKEFLNYAEKYKNIMEKLRKPVARMEILDVKEFLHGACDISDGLAKEIRYFKNFEIYGDKLLKSIPEDVLSFCDEFNLDPIKVALNSGEEFEILFTTDKLNKVKKHVKVNKIGKIIENGQYIDGKELKDIGYVHKW
ncbi:thiamine-monophosphate kinase [Methanocaldococcus villosus KIN24-T80]|uniref:Thiamine-monophosphate kinase n=1 Tax=Methanocaldococcus villosus KIN24-T80 TaxID=1069083 RepID=N6VRY9_9EURY|nr:thiamine-phosphate kinase [Methanocaldococcus villosus]ENN95926.1 thiamine-monophosphate kinase [Methanocaldococcus villosus KIN24-T80]